MKKHVSKIQRISLGIALALGLSATQIKPADPSSSLKRSDVHKGMAATYGVLRAGLMCIGTPKAKRIVTQLDTVAILFTFSEFLSKMLTYDSESNKYTYLHYPPYERVLMKDIWINKRIFITFLYAIMQAMAIADSYGNHTSLYKDINRWALLNVSTESLIQAYSLYKKLRTNQKASHIKQAITAHPLNVGGKGQLKDEPLQKLIFEYAGATPLDFRILLPLDNAPNFMGMKLGMPTLLDDGQIRINATYYHRYTGPNHTHGGTNRAFILTPSAQLASSDPIIITPGRTISEWMLEVTPVDQDIILPDGRRCKVHCERMPSRTEEGLLVGTLYDEGPYLFVKKQAKELGISVAEFFAPKDSVATPSEQDTPLMAPAFPITFLTKATGSSTSSSSGDTENQRELTERYESKEEKKDR